MASASPLFTPSFIALLLSDTTPLSVTSQLSALLGVPTRTPPTDPRFALGAPLPGTLQVELLYACFEMCRELHFTTPQATSAMNALHTLLTTALGAPQWPSYASACEVWEAALARITAPLARQQQQQQQQGGAVTESGDGDPTAHLLTGPLAQGLDAWVRENSVLLPHHWAMYGEALAGQVGAGKRMFTTIAVVEEPPPAECIPGLGEAVMIGGQEQ